MKFKNILDEALVKGEQIRDEVIHELLKSKKIHELVTNKNFVKAITRIIETKDEVKKVINKQVKTIFEMMDVPTKAELKKIGAQIGKVEALIEKVGRKKIAVKSLTKTKKPAATKRKTTATKRKTAKKPAKSKKTTATKSRTTATKRKTTRKKPASRKR